MSSFTTAIPTEEQLELLRQVCARNTPLELHIQANKQLVTGRSRFLELRDEAICIDQPRMGGEGKPLRERQIVLVHFLLSGTRYSFETRVRRVHCSVQLNQQLRVPGVSLGVPPSIKEQQRRTDFRLSLASHAKIDIIVHTGSPLNGGSAPAKTKVLRPGIINISCGGMCVLFDLGDSKPWQSGDIFFLSFQLPEVSDRFLFMAELRHKRPIERRENCVIGFKFLPWSLVPTQKQLVEVTKFIATEQRKQLRNKSKR